jgi:hypothetical protein
VKLVETWKTRAGTNRICKIRDQKWQNNEIIADAASHVTAKRRRAGYRLDFCAVSFARIGAGEDQAAAIPGRIF